MTCKRQGSNTGVNMTIVVFVLLCLSLFIVTTKAGSGPYYQSVHGDLTKLPKSCGSCHKGHGIPDSPMLSGKGGDSCYPCHGEKFESDDMKTKGFMIGTITLKNLRQVFAKPFRHPLGAGKDHNPLEMLPEKDPGKPRHSECVDCHDPHRQPRSSGSGEPVMGERRRVLFRDVTFEYDLCYRCHATSANLPAYEFNKQEEFSPANPSYHPVEAVGKGTSVPSLLPPWSLSSIVNCTDCHGNDDPSGPRGPHGSIYEPILRNNYTRPDGSPESFLTYAVCYQCHRRESIIADESFPSHKKHVVDNNISCYTCHDSHGSRLYPSLIRFNKDPRFPAVSGLLLYVPHGASGKPECTLTCHIGARNVDVEHSGSTVRVVAPTRTPSLFPRTMEPQGFPPPPPMRQR